MSIHVIFCGLLKFFYGSAMFRKIVIGPAWYSLTIVYDRTFKRKTHPNNLVKISYKH